jgi:hypothetical protein
MYRSALPKAQVGQKAKDARRRPQAAMAWQQQTVTNTAIASNLRQYFQRVAKIKRA